MSRKGEEIRIVAGTYKGYTGCIDNSKQDTVASISVIVNAFKKRSGGTVDKSATIRKSSLRPAKIPAPASYGEAIMQQHPKIEQMLEKLCRQLAKCEVGRGGSSIQVVFATKLQEAVAKQLALAGDAEWKFVCYPPPQDDAGDKMNDAGEKMA